MMNPTTVRALADRLDADQGSVYFRYQMAEAIQMLRDLADRLTTLEAHIELLRNESDARHIRIVEEKARVKALEAELAQYKAPGPNIDN